MGLDILGAGGIGDAIAAVANVVGKFVPDANIKASAVAEAQKAAEDLAAKAADAQHQIELAEIDLLKAQAATNTAEAGNSNMFISGWRAFAGWAAAVTVFGGVWFGMVMLALGKDGISSALSILLSIPVSILFGMLGLHSAERKWGVAPDQSASGVPTPLPAPRAQLVKK